MIIAERTIEATVEQISFGRTVIDWNRQRLVFMLNGAPSYEHKLSQAEWNYLINGLGSLMGNVPQISNVVIPAFNVGIDDE